MAIRTVNISGGYFPTIIRECDTSNDFSGITNNTIFKNLDDSLIYQKDFNGNITSLFFTGGTISGGLTATTISGTTLYGDGSNITNVTSNLGLTFALSNSNYYT